MTAFCLVPWIALLAVVASADVADALHALRRHAEIQHERARRIFKTGHNFSEVGKRYARAGGFAVIADDQGSLIVEREGTLNIVVVLHAALVVVVVDGVKGCANVIGRDERAEIHDAGKILADQLIDNIEHWAAGKPQHLVT